MISRLLGYGDPREGMTEEQRKIQEQAFKLVKKHKFIKNVETIIGRVDKDVQKGTAVVSRYARGVESEMSTAKEILDHVE